MKYLEIPTKPSPQQFTIALAGTRYQLRLLWRDGGWVLDILSDAGEPILCGVAVVTGVDLLEPYPDLGLGGALYAGTMGDIDAPPTFENLGSNGKLFFGVPE